MMTTARHYQDGLIHQMMRHGQVVNDSTLRKARLSARNYIQELCDCNQLIGRLCGLQSSLKAILALDGDVSSQLEPELLQQLLTYPALLKKWQKKLVKLNHHDPHRLYVLVSVLQEDDLIVQYNQYLSSIENYFNLLDGGAKQIVEWIVRFLAVQSIDAELANRLTQQMASQSQRSNIPRLQRLFFMTTVYAAAVSLIVVYRLSGSGASALDVLEQMQPVRHDLPASLWPATLLDERRYLNVSRLITQQIFTNPTTGPKAKTLSYLLRPNDEAPVGLWARASCVSKNIYSVLSFHLFEKNQNLFTFNSLCLTVGRRKQVMLYRGILALIALHKKSIAFLFDWHAVHKDASPTLAALCKALLPYFHQRYLDRMAAGDELFASDSLSLIQDLEQQRLLTSYLTSQVPGLNTVSKKARQPLIQLICSMTVSHVKQAYSASSVQKNHQNKHQIVNRDEYNLHLNQLAKTSSVYQRRLIRLSRQASRFQFHRKNASRLLDATLFDQLYCAYGVALDLSRVDFSHLISNGLVDHHHPRPIYYNYLDQQHDLVRGLLENGADITLESAVETQYLAGRSLLAYYADSESWLSIKGGLSTKLLHMVLASNAHWMQAIETHNDSMLYVYEQLETFSTYHEALKKAIIGYAHYLKQYVARGHWYEWGGSYFTPTQPEDIRLLQHYLLAYKQFMRPKNIREIYVALDRFFLTCEKHKQQGDDGWFQKSSATIISQPVEKLKRLFASPTSANILRAYFYQEKIPLSAQTSFFLPEASTTKIESHTHRYQRFFFMLHPIWLALQWLFDVIYAVTSNLNYQDADRSERALGLQSL